MSKLIKSDKKINFFGHLVPKIETYEKFIAIYQEGITAIDFYEEPIEADLVYPDW